MTNPPAEATLYPAWRPHASWHDTALRVAVGVASDDPEHAAQHWRELAMLCGDTHAPELCLIVSIYGRKTFTGEARRRFAGHANLAMWDLGLAKPRQTEADGSASIGGLTQEGAMTPPSRSTLEAWLEEALAPFDGDLEAAALTIVGLAVERTAKSKSGPAR